MFRPPKSASARVAERLEINRKFKAGCSSAPISIEAPARDIKFRLIMIICVSANPAIDRRLHLAQLWKGQVNRARSARPAAGGKAAHVALAARALGSETTWVGFLGGPTGEECANGLRSCGINVRPIYTKSATRVNFELIEADGTITEVLEPGGMVEPGESEELISQCRQLFAEYQNTAVVVLAGSLPPGVPVVFYAQLTEAAHRYRCRVMLDTSGEALVIALGQAPDFVKPNRDEAEWALGQTVRDESSAIGAARWMIKRGARSAAVSLGADGLLWSGGADADSIMARPPLMAGVSTVGCGDATVAGFAVAAERSLSPEEAVRLATACGAANCLAALPGMIELREVNRIAPLVKVKTGGEGNQV